MYVANSHTSSLSAVPSIAKHDDQLFYTILDSVESEAKSPPHILHVSKPINMCPSLLDDPGPARLAATSPTREEEVNGGKTTDAYGRINTRNYYRVGRLWPTNERPRSTSIRETAANGRTDYPSKAARRTLQTIQKSQREHWCLHERQ